MARKEVINKDILLTGAFTLVEKKGTVCLTARKLAEAAGCSTQPIFRLYENMEELEKELFDKVAEYFGEFCMEFPKTEKTPFVNLGLAYICFAKKHANLFRMLFVDGDSRQRSMYDLVNGEEHGFVIAEIKKISGVTPQKASELFMKMWTFIHGMACMALTGDFDLEDAEAAAMLKDAYSAFAK